MAITYERKKQRQSNIFYTIVTAILICAVFFAMVTSFYLQAEENAYEMLHIQGWYYAKAMPIDDCEGFIERYSC